MAPRFSTHVWMFAVLLALATPAFGQGGGGTAEVNGTVMDPGQSVRLPIGRAADEGRCRASPRRGVRCDR